MHVGFRREIDMSILISDKKGENKSHNLSKAQAMILPILRNELPFADQIWNEITKLAINALKEVGLGIIPRKFVWWYYSRIMIKKAKEGYSLLEIETSLREITRKRFKKERDKRPNLEVRASRCFHTIKDYIKGEDILDLGAGDGLLGENIVNRLNKRVMLFDIIDYNYSTLPMNVFSEGDPIPLPSNSVDTTILYTVLHHAMAPRFLLEEAVRVTKKRLIIVEGYIDTTFHYRINSFFDWFLNRVIKDEDVPIPLNYNTTAKWDHIFRSEHLQITKKVYLGVDEPLAPEFHVLYVLDKQGRE